MSNPHVPDMRGAIFGYLIVLERDGSNKKGQATWLCDCACGDVAVKVGSELRRRADRVQSCGCAVHEPATTKSFVHGESGRNQTREYRAWVNMRYRCFNPQCVDWNDYGGRGISVCGRWASYETFPG